MIDLISELTGLSIIIYLSSSGELFSDKSFPDFCHEIENITSTACICELDSGKELHMCEAGLWCRSYPMSNNGQNIGKIIIGYRRINGKDNESIGRLNEFMNKYNINLLDKNKLYSAFERVPIVKEQDFRSPLFDKVNILTEYVLDESKRTQMQKIYVDKLEKFSNEARISSIKAAHELLIPIQSMVGITEYLYTCLKKNTPTTFCGEQPTTAIAHELLERLIKFSFMADNLRGIESHNLRYDFKKIDYIKALQDTINLFKEEGIKKGIMIEDIKFISHPTHIIEASEYHIKQLFFNIIHNAIKYSFATTNENKRYISIACIGYQDRIGIKVSNYGIGILEKELKSNLIFQQGYRGELAADRNRIGSGLGLWMAKRVVDDHHGEIKIESRIVGEGIKIDPYLTTVSIYLPIKQQ